MQSSSPSSGTSGSRPSFVRGAESLLLWYESRDSASSLARDAAVLHPYKARRGDAAAQLLSPYRARGQAQPLSGSLAMATLNRTLRLLPSARPCLLQHPLRATFSTSQSRRAISTPSPETSKRTAIVTGSSRGIGKAIALRLARDGYDVCINDIPANSSGCDAVAEEVERLGRRACVALADISKFNEVEGMIQTSVKKLGELNTMIANAGIAQVKPLLDLTEEDFERMFRINVFGCQNTYKAAAKQLIAQGNCKPDNPGKLIGAASIVAFKPFPLLSHYSASKWAVRGLTQAYAMEMAEHNITVNAYGPGIVGTAMWDQIDEGLGKKTGAKKGDTIKKYSGELIALGRVSVPEDVAKLVSFLASRDSDYVTGQTQLVDGGIIMT
ncbi:3-oxoacyl-reductase [Hortaea werneckii]|nr:3-oxoacyl-reductase [Hortaea werneckii]KAI7648711.1 3-oxoacyl-reductase [Hortaea werneckii]